MFSHSDLLSPDSKPKFHPSASTRLSTHDRILCNFRAKRSFYEASYKRAIQETSSLSRLSPYLAEEWFFRFWIRKLMVTMALDWKRESGSQKFITGTTLLILQIWPLNITILLFIYFSLHISYAFELELSRNYILVGMN